MKHVILCDEDGKPLGKSDHFSAHSGEGKLHLAFSVFLFRHDGTEMLLQKRSQKKMLFPGVWANSCCSHPQENEELLVTAARRLEEELGVTPPPLLAQTSFVYRAPCLTGKGSEHEHDTIILGEVEHDAVLKPNPDEIDEIRWISLEDLVTELDEKPEIFAPWFPIALSKLFES